LDDLWDVFVRDRQLGTTERVSVDTSGAAANGESGYPCISADGRYVFFESWASDLVTGDTNEASDIFVRDRTGGTTTRVSVSSAGAQGDDSSVSCSASADGRYVVFESDAANLVADDTNGMADIFVRDRASGTTRRVSRDAAGVQADYESYWPSISADGMYITFSSVADNLVPDDTNFADDVFAVLTPTVPSYGSIRGSDRYDTAIRISKALFPAALPAGAGLVVAPGETFQEALCGAPLAAAWGGPVLLTYQSALANNVKAELQRLAPTQVFCIGLSTAAVAQVRDAVQAVLPGATVTALNGAGATADIVYDMSRKVANALEAKVGDMTGATAIVTVGTNFPDAIGVSPLACSRLWPIILTNQPGSAALHTAAAGALADLGIVKAIKVGTYATLPTNVAGLTNCSGTDRYVTNAKVATWAASNAGLSFTHTALATGDKFPDALAAGPYLAADDGTLLLSPLTGPLPSVIGNLITAKRTEVQQVTYVACIEPVIGQVKALLP